MSVRKAYWTAPVPWWAGYIGAVALVGLAALAAAAFQRLPHANLSLVFLLAVLIVATVWGLWPSIVGGVLGFLALNFFFTVPRFTLTVAEEGDVATLVFFLAMAALTGKLAARMRTEMATTRVALGRVSTLLDLSRRVAASVDTEQALSALAGALAHVYEAPVAVWLPDATERLRPVAVRRTEDATAVFGVDAVNRLWTSGHPQFNVAGGISTVPLGTSGRRLGLVTIAAALTGRDQRALTEGLCEQASIAVERIRLVDDLKEAQLVSQTERLRSALLSSVSHDMKTPLASIIGSVSSVLEYGEKLRQEDQRELLQTVVDESQRLNRYIQNLLDMTRFGQERIEVTREWVDLDDLVSAAVERLGTAIGHIELRVDIGQDVSLMFVQGALIEQALVNVLDNAADFSEAGGCVSVQAFRDGEDCVIDVVDQGPGIAAEDRARIFDMFFSASQGDRRRHGVGLGLAISRSIVSAHGGTIEALPGDDGAGTRIRLRLPQTNELIGSHDA